LHHLFLAFFTDGSAVGEEVFAEGSVTVGRWERGKDISTSSTGLHTDRASSGLDLVMPALASSSRNYTRWGWIRKVAEEAHLLIASVIPHRKADLYPHGTTSLVQGSCVSELGPLAGVDFPLGQCVRGCSDGPLWQLSPGRLDQPAFVPGGGGGRAELGWVTWSTLARHDSSTLRWGEGWCQEGYSSLSILHCPQPRGWGGARVVCWIRIVCSTRM
jgi:hypothetical protein